MLIVIKVGQSVFINNATYDYQTKPKPEGTKKLGKPIKLLF